MPVQPGVAGSGGASPHLLGNWGGIRDWLNSRGIRPSVSYVGENSVNLNSGSRRTPRYADTRAFGASVDAPNLLGRTPAEVQVTLTWKSGQEISARNDLGILQFPTSIYGRGTIWRLTQAWYRAASGPWDAKIGRLTVGEDFASAGCEFQSLYFCGAAPGQIAHTVWNNYPVGQWGTRIKRKFGTRGYVQAAAYHVSPRNADPVNGGFYLGLDGGGLLFPVEIGWTPRLRGDLPGTYKIGAYVSTANEPDVVLDRDHGLAFFTGRERLMQHGSSGFYANVRQQVSHARSSGGGATALFANVAFTDGRTTAWVSKVVGGLVHTGPLAGRPRDEAGFALGRVGINRRIRDLQMLRNAHLPGSVAVQRAEYVAELYYGAQLLQGLMVRPNLQYVHQPGGVAERSDIVLAGLKIVASF